MLVCPVSEDVRMDIDQSGALVVGKYDDLINFGVLKVLCIYPNS